MVTLLLSNYICWVTVGLPKPLPWFWRSPCKSSRNVIQTIQVRSFAAITTPLHQSLSVVNSSPFIISNLARYLWTLSIHRRLGPSNGLFILFGIIHFVTWLIICSRSLSNLSFYRILWHTYYFFVRILSLSLSLVLFNL